MTVEHKAERDGKAQPDGLAKSIWQTMSHPLRVKILHALFERTASPVEVARELHEPVGNVSYHFRALEKSDLIELVETKQRRGATEHYYRAVHRPWLTTEEWVDLSLEERLAISTWILRMVVANAGVSLATKHFDSRGDRHLSRTPLSLDEEGWRDLSGLMDATLDRALDIQAESDERRTQSGEEASAVVTALLTFPMPGPPSYDKVVKRP